MRNVSSVNLIQSFKYSIPYEIVYRLHTRRQKLLRKRRELIDSIINDAKK